MRDFFLAFFPFVIFSFRDFFLRKKSTRKKILGKNLLRNNFSTFSGHLVSGPGGNRTHDLLIANEVFFH